MARTQGGRDLRDMALSLHDALTDLVRSYQARDREAICCYDVSLVQSQAIERLARRGPMAMQAFATSLFLEKSSASRLVDGLVNKGYLVRRSDENDGRIVRLELTKSGRALARRLEDDMAEARAEMLEGLSRDERETVVDALRTLSESAALGWSRGE